MPADHVSIGEDDPPATVLNTLAAEQSDDDWLAAEADRDPIISMSHELLDEQLDRQQTLKTETILSKREAEVVALKEHGLTLDAIALVFAVSESYSHVDPNDPNAAKQFIDTQYQRAHNKYEHAVRTVDALDTVFGSDE